jgi:nucleotidyltransferase/DNA polymerase involved in DNA repair
VRSGVGSSVGDSLARSRPPSAEHLPFAEPPLDIGEEERTFVITSASRRRKEPKSSPENTGIARRRQPDRERKSSGSETTFSEDLIDPVQIETAVIAMADDVWAWCEKVNARGRTVTVKIKWADFQISTRSRSMQMTVQTREKLHQLALDLIRSVFPPQRHSTRRRDAFELSSAIRQRSS